MLTSEQLRLIAEDLAITCQTSMTCDAGPLPDGFTASLTMHLEAWLRNPAMVAAVNFGPKGDSYAEALDRLYAGLVSRLHGYADVTS